MQSFITINGTKFPQPRRGLELLSATIVDSARNANGVVVGQKVGRDQQKLNNLFWGYRRTLPKQIGSLTQLPLSTLRLA